jgi:hypothetical protein
MSDDDAKRARMSGTGDFGQVSVNAGSLLL